VTLRDSATAQRSGSDLLLQEIPTDLVVYRMVANDPPTTTDFQSHYERGVQPRPGLPFHAYAWLGVSVFLDRARAERLAETARRRGGPAAVATLILTSGTGLWGVYTVRTTHLELFALPQDLLDRVDTWS
jgi:hypothetical protein